MPIKKGRLRGLFYRVLKGLLQVLANQAGQFKHGHLGFAKDRAQFVIGIDVALVDFVLQAMLFDVCPHLADHLGASQRSSTHHSGQSGAGGQCTHECGIGCALLGWRLFRCFFGRGFFRHNLFSRRLFGWRFLSRRFFSGYFFCRCFLRSDFFGRSGFFCSFFAGAFFAVAMIQFPSRRE